MDTKKNIKEKKSTKKKENTSKTKKVISQKKPTKKTAAVKENNVKNIRKTNPTKEEVIVKKNLDKKTIYTYLGLLIFDIGLTIFIARQNMVNYINIENKKIFASKYQYLLLGRNYVNLIIISFFYIYTLVINKYFLKHKNTIKFLLGLLAGIIILNLLLFFIFTKRIY